MLLQFWHYMTCCWSADPLLSHHSLPYLLENGLSFCCEQTLRRQGEEGEKGTQWTSDGLCNDCVRMLKTHALQDFIMSECSWEQRWCKTMLTCQVVRVERGKLFARRCPNVECDASSPTLSAKLRFVTWHLSDLLGAVQPSQLFVTDGIISLVTWSPQRTGLFKETEFLHSG